MKAKEGNIQTRILLALSQARLTMFRQNTGLGWVGLIKKGSKTADEVTLINPRPLHAGLIKGSSDLIGWQSITVTPEMVGKQVAIFTACEVKAEDGVASEEQKNFIKQVNLAGGCAIISKEPGDAVAQIEFWRQSIGASK